MITRRSTPHAWVTTPDFRPCSTCPSRSQARLCPCTLVGVMAIHPERTIGRLRYPLGGDRPSQTPHLALSAAPLLGVQHETPVRARVVFHRCLPATHKQRISGSHLSYAGPASRPGQGRVKLHGVFLSCRGKPASSRVRQFRRALRRDSAQVVMPFVRVGTYPTRNFATLGPL